MFPIHALLLDVLDYNLRLNPHCVAPEIETYQLRSDTKELLLIDILITGAICGCCTAALLQGGKHDKSTFQLCMIWIMGIISLHLAVTIFVVTINRHWNEGTYIFLFEDSISGVSGIFLTAAAIAFAIYLRRKGVIYLSLLWMPYLLYIWVF